ncbi:MAG TPA: hypothetical protein VJ873_11130 [bacterium]|nr:hypothetical protein [bacterium]
MKELITEEQAGQIVLALSILVTLSSVGFGLFWNSRVEKTKKKIFWANVVISAVLGPVIWAFWQVYNSIENYYGLDSVKALGINFSIAVGLGAVFVILFHFAPRWISKPTVSRSRK